MKGFKPTPHAWDALLASLGPAAASGQQHGELSSRPCGWMIATIAHEEPQAERSLMHRFDTAQKLVERAGKAEDADEALAAVLVWLRREGALSVCPHHLSRATEVQPMACDDPRLPLLGYGTLPCATRLASYYQAHSHPFPQVLCCAPPGLQSLPPPSRLPHLFRYCRAHNSPHLPPGSPLLAT